MPDRHGRRLALLAVVAVALAASVRPAEAAAVVPSSVDVRAASYLVADLDHEALLADIAADRTSDPATRATAQAVADAATRDAVLVRQRFAVWGVSADQLAAAGVSVVAPPVVSTVSPLCSLHGVSVDVQRVHLADPGVVSVIFAEEALNLAVQGRDLIASDPTPAPGVKVVMTQVDNDQRSIMQSLAPFLAGPQQEFAASA